MVELCTPDFITMGGSGWGFRKIDIPNPHKIRLFFLSLLWRAAASKLPEMNEIGLRASDFRRLTAMVRDGRSEPFSFLPISINQISSMGPAHNRAPAARIKPMNPLNPDAGPKRPIFRFYLDGLAILFDRKGGDDLLESQGPMVVGYTDHLIISTVTFERSWQRQEMAHKFASAYELEEARLQHAISAGEIFSGHTSEKEYPALPAEVANNTRLYEEAIASLGFRELARALSVTRP